MLKRLMNGLRRLVDMATCHHCLYFLLFACYAAAELQLVDKAVAGQAVSLVYFALSLRP